MDDKSPLYSLSIEQFKALLDEKLQNFQKHPYKSDVVFETDNVSIDWVSENLCIPKSTIRTKVSRGEMPCKKRGKPMLFSKKDMNDWLEKGKPKISREIDFCPINKKL
jgi:excisionase family DNA binding protein